MKPKIFLPAKAGVALCLALSIRKCAAAMALMLFLCVTVHAQNEELLDRAVTVDIAAQSLNSALLLLGRQAHIQVMMPSRSVDGLHAEGVHGAMTLRQALSALLEGTRLDYYTVGPNTIRIGVRRSGDSSGKRNTSAAAGRRSGPGALKPRRGLEEVVVTAQKHAQSVNDAGISISVFTGDKLRAMGVETPSDMALVTPGLTVNDVAPTGVPQYSIRGVGFQDFSTGASSTVGLYFDGVNIPYSVMSRGAVFDIRRVEVLKGPQGDLYGRNTTAGQINFISNKPTEDFKTGIRATYSSYKTVALEGYVSGPLTDSARGRLAFRKIKSDEGWQRSLTRHDKLGKKDLNAIRTIFDYDITDSATLEFNFHYVKDKSDNQAPQAFNGRELGLDTVAIAPYNPLQNYTSDLVTLTSTPPWFTKTGETTRADWSNSYTSAITGTTWTLRPQRDNDLKGASARLDWDLGGITLTSLTAFDGFRRTEAFEGDGGAFIDTSNINTTDINVFSQELRLSGQADGLLWIAGLYYSKDNLHERYHFFMPDSVYGNGSIPWGVAPFDLAPILQLDTRYRQKTESKAIFGHVEWSVTEQWKLTLGARYTDEQRDWSGCTFSAADNSLGNFLNTLFGTTLQAGDCGTIDDNPASPTYIFNVLGTPNANDAFHVYSDSVTTRKWMGKVGIDYHVNDDILLYATWSRGFKSGGFNGAASNVTSQLRPYGPEELTAYEVGAKMSLFDRTMQLNASTFYYDYKDKQEADVAVSFVGNISGLTNVPKSRIYGAEAEWQWAPIDGLNMNFSVAWLDTEVKKWRAVDPVASVWPNVVTYDASGTELPQAPKWSYNGSISYQWSIATNLYLRLGADFNHKDKTTGGANLFAYATPDYTVYNARITLGDLADKWSVQIWSHNLTDEFYYPSAYAANGPYVRVVGMPRTVGVTFDYRY